MKLNRLVSTSGMDHATWLEYRKKGIGGSDAGSICGLNPYATAISVYQDKTQEEVTEKADNESMRQGRDLEVYGRDRKESAPCKFYFLHGRKSFHAGQRRPADCRRERRTRV